MQLASQLVDYVYNEGTVAVFSVILPAKPVACLRQIILRQLCHWPMALDVLDYRGFFEIEVSSDEAVRAISRAAKMQRFYPRDKYF